MLKEGIDIAGIRYEDIISDPSFACKKILKYIGMPESLSEKALRGLQVDSQRNSKLSMKNLSGYRDSLITGKSKRLANELLSKYGLPNLDEETLLPGTITAKAKHS